MIIVQVIIYFKIFSTSTCNGAALQQAWIVYYRIDSKKTIGSQDTTAKRLDYKIERAQRHNQIPLVHITAP